MCLFKYTGGDNAHWISKNKMAATAVQWELCDTNFHENITNLWVSCCNGNNDRSARVLFVQHPREQGELRSGFDCIIGPAPSGAGRTTPSQHGHYRREKFKVLMPICEWNEPFRLSADFSLVFGTQTAIADADPQFCWRVKKMCLRINSKFTKFTNRWQQLSECADAGVFNVLASCVIWTRLISWVIDYTCV